MLKSRLYPHVLALGLAVPGLAVAATVDIQDIVGAWSNGIPAANVTIDNSNPALATARWGADGPQSGYDFEPAAGTVSVVVPPSPSSDFTLGTFRHINKPINAGTSITSIVLTVTAKIIIDGADQGTRSFVFDFTHDETPNGANPCADGNPNGVGVNVNGCADKVSVGYNNLSETFVIGSDTYTLNIVGFLIGGNPASVFWTMEQATNTALLRANVALRSEVEVPEPVTLAIFGLGLAGLGLVARRRTG